MSSSQSNGNPHFTANGKILRIGLISPTSGNLGNAAMQSSMIANLRKRIPGVEIIGITLNPGDTRRRHGIEAFPLAAVSRPNYGLYDSGPLETTPQQPPKLGAIRQSLKKSHLLRSCWVGIRTFRLEIAHIVAAARLVRNLDRLMIPGGGALDDFWGGPWGQPWALFKWSLLSKVFGVPFLFVSIGKCSLEGQLSHFFAKSALRTASYRSYRDNDSKLAVRTLIDSSNDPVYPDLAFSYPDPIVGNPRDGSTEDGRLVVGFSPIAYCDPRAWPYKDERRYAAYVSKLGEVVNWLLTEKYRVLFFTTDSPDSATMEDIKALIPTGALTGDAIQFLPGSDEQSVDSLLKGISRVDLTIASRLHGVILSHLNSTPVLALSFDGKVDSHMRSIGQAHYCLNIDDFRLDTLSERFNALKLSREQESAQISRTTSTFRHQLDGQYNHILGGSQSNSVTRDNHSQIGTDQLAEISKLRTK
jgi:polysaccharide pyruvyl transferase WcaK-like protein